MLEFLKSIDTKTRIVAVTCALVLIALAGGATWVSSRPHFVELFTGLGEQERAKVGKALSEGNLRYRFSQPPGPYTVFVDDDEYFRAQNLAMLAEAVKPGLRGIVTGDSGAGSIFMTANERMQSALKRNWQEMEKQLEDLEFIASATVTTSRPDGSALRASRPAMVSVTLQLHGPHSLTPQQGETVTRLVCYGFDVPTANVVISDQRGNTLSAPADEGGDGMRMRGFSEFVATQERRLQEKANEALALFGGGLAHATVTAEYDNRRRSSVSDNLDPESKVLLTEQSSTTESSGPESGVGGPTGISANLGFGATSGAAGGGTIPLNSSKDKTTHYEASRERVATVEDTPILERLSVAVVVDQSLDARRADIEAIVKAAIGFVTTRGDMFSIQLAPLAPVAEVSSEGEAATTGGEAPAGPNPLMERGLDVALEVIAAIVFLGLLFKTLKSGGGARKAPTRVALPGGGTLETYDDESVIAPDPEMLARAQIEQLVRTDPRRVGQILSRWAAESSAAGARR